MNGSVLKAAFNDTVITPLIAPPLVELNQDQTIGLLDNLGYIRLGSNSPLTISATERATALGLFRTELSNSQLSNKPVIASGSVLSTPEIQFAQHLTAVDHGLRLADFDQPQIQTDPLLTRVLNYRLCLLRLRADLLLGSFSQGTELALEQLASLTNQPQGRQLLALLDDFDQLTHRLIAPYLTSDPVINANDFGGIIYFQNLADSGAEQRFNPNARVFLQAMDPLISQDMSEQRTIIRLASRTNANRITGLSSTQRQRIVTLSRHFNNLFFIRLVQLRLFLTGTLGGRLDDQLKPLSLQAIADFVALENHDEPSLVVDPRQLIIKIDPDIWAVNAIALLQAMLRIPPAASTTTGIAGHIQALAGQLPQDQQHQLYASVNTLVDQQYPTNDEIDADKVLRRPVKNRGFFARIGAFFAKVGRAIFKGIEAIIDAIKALFGWIKNGITQLLTEIRQAIANFETTADFIFGDRIVINGNIHTHFDADFDATTDLIGPTSSIAIEEQIAKLTEIKTSVIDSAQFLSTSVPIVIDLLKPPLGWLAAGISLVKTVDL